MGELARERQELLAGMDPQKLEALRVAGDTGKMDPDLGKLLQRLAAADLAGLNEALKALDRDLKGGEGAQEWTKEQLQALKDAIDALAETLKDGAGTLEDRKALQSTLRALGDPALLAELSKRMGRLMETLAKQGWKPCQSKGGLNPDGAGDGDPGDSIALTPEQLEAMIERLKELQELADLGQLAFCQNCDLSPGGT
jgi:ABC-type transporter Mla subunit MlaD